MTKKAASAHPKPKQELTNPNNGSETSLTEPNLAAGSAPETAPVAAPTTPPNTPPCCQHRHETPAQNLHVSKGFAVAAAWSWRVLAVGAAIYFALQMFATFQVLIVPILVALLITTMLTPVTNFLCRFLPRGLCVGIVVTATVLTLVGLGVLVGTQFARGSDELTKNATAGIKEVQDWLTDGPLHLTDAKLEQWTQTALAQLKANNGKIMQGAFAITTTAGHVIAGLAITLFAVIFMLLDGAGMWRWILRLLPKKARKPMAEASSRGWVTLTAYVRATMAVAAVDAIGIGIGAAILGVPLAIPIAVLVFLSAFIPVVGALLSGAVAVLVALVALGPVKALIMLLIVVGVQQLESHILQPFLLGKAVSVHPLAVIIAIAAGAIVAGIVGALFAVPLVAVLNTMVTYLNGGGDSIDEMTDAAVVDQKTDADADKLLPSKS